MKRKNPEPYDKVKIEIITFSCMDVIATSEFSGDDMDDDGWTSV